MWRNLANELRELWRLSGEPSSAYRPDLHYMRGPGPKWHAKYGSLAQKAVPLSRPNRGIHGIAQHGA